MIEIVLFLLIVFLYIRCLNNLYYYDEENKSTIYICILKRIIGFIELAICFTLAQYSIISWLYIVVLMLSNFILFLDLDVILHPFRDFKKIHRNMSVNPEQKLNYNIFKQIFIIDPKSFILTNNCLYYIDENQEHRKFYINYIDLYRALKLIYEYQTKGINSNATPITDDMLKKIKREHEKGEKLQAEAIEGLTKASENWKI